MTEKPKAQVILKPREPRARVIRTPGTHEDFVRTVREVLGVDQSYGFTPEDLQRIVQNSNLAPIRVVFELRGRKQDGAEIGTWMLYLRRLSANTISVYSPREGVKVLKFADGVHKFRDFMFNDQKEAQWGPPTTGKLGVTSGKVTITSTTRRELLNPPSEETYEIPEGPLLKLGSTQTTEADCGPLCLYAAKVARGR